MILQSIIPNTRRPNRQPIHIINGILAPHIHPPLTNDAKVTQARSTNQPNSNPHNVQCHEDHDLTDIIKFENVLIRDGAVYEDGVLELDSVVTVDRFY